MPRPLRYLFATLLAALLIGSPIAYAVYRQSQFRNLRVVRPGVLYRSGQLSLPALKSTIRDCGIKTVVTLRDSLDPRLPPPDLDEQKYCEAQEINYVRISPRSWWSPDGSIPADEGVRQFRVVMDNPANFPVLIHCYAGIHRTGAFTAVYRMEYEHYSNDQAIAELMANGYRDLEDEWDLLTFLQKYQPTRRMTNDQ